MTFGNVYVVFGTHILYKDLRVNEVYLPQYNALLFSIAFVKSVE